MSLARLLLTDHFSLPPSYHPPKLNHQLLDKQKQLKPCYSSSRIDERASLNRLQLNKHKCNATQLNLVAYLRHRWICDLSIWGTASPGLSDPPTLRLFELAAPDSIHFTWTLDTPPAYLLTLRRGSPCCDPPSSSCFSPPPPPGRFSIFWCFCDCFWCLICICHSCISTQNAKLNACLMGVIDDDLRPNVHPPDPTRLFLSGLWFIRRRCAARMHANVSNNRLSGSTN